jgi:hypothetical protein
MTIYHSERNGWTPPASAQTQALPDANPFGGNDVSF